MKRKISITILIILGLLYIHTCAERSILFDVELAFIKKRIPVREISVKVVDEITKEPIKGIPVYYILSSGNLKNRFFAFVPSMDIQDHVKNEKILQLETNEKGEVRIPKDVVWVNWPRKIESEELIINLQLNQEERLNCLRMEELAGHYYWTDLGIYSQNVNREKLINPVSQYKGFKIYSSERWFKYPHGPKYACGTKSCFLDNPEWMLTKKKVSTLVELKRN